jgi:hypothetical protein
MINLLFGTRAYFPWRILEASAVGLLLITGCGSESNTNTSSASVSSSSQGGSDMGGAGGAGGTSGSAGNGGTGGSPMLGPAVYFQPFDSLKADALWKNNLDGAKIKAHPENAFVTAMCGSDGSNCLRIVYRHADGIHKQPPPSPVFTTTGNVIGWTPSDATHTGTATDVIQANLPIDGTTDGSGDNSNAPIPGKAYTLTYDLFFEPGFDFAKGGKLPGLASKTFDSGCTEDGNAKRNGTNWSVRMMWRNNGRLQLYSYDQTRPSGSCGVTQMVDAAPGDAPYEMPGMIPQDNKFRFKTGTWYTVRLSVRINDNESVTYQKDAGGNLVLDANGDPIPTAGNGAMSLAIMSADGQVKRLLVAPNVALRDECNGPCPASVPDSPESQINGIFFSTFYGGNEVKRTTCQSVMPSYPGLTQPIFDTLCASQKLPEIFPTLTWEPKTPSAALFDNLKVVEGYTAAPL